MRGIGSRWCNPGECCPEVDVEGVLMSRREGLAHFSSQKLLSTLPGHEDCCPFRAPSDPSLWEALLGEISAIGPLQRYHNRPEPTDAPGDVGVRRSEMRSSPVERTGPLRGHAVEREPSGSGRPSRGFGHASARNGRAPPIVPPSEPRLAILFHVAGRGLGSGASPAPPPAIPRPGTLSVLDVVLDLVGGVLLFLPLLRVPFLRVSVLLALLPFLCPLPAPCHRFPRPFPCPLGRGVCPPLAPPPPSRGSPHRLPPWHFSSSPLTCFLDPPRRIFHSLLLLAILLLLPVLFLVVLLILVAVFFLLLLPFPPCGRPRCRSRSHPRRPPPPCPSRRRAPVRGLPAARNALPPSEPLITRPPLRDPCRRLASSRSPFRTEPPLFLGRPLSPPRSARVRP
ncbi:proline-rich protein 36-like [Tachyglossus aculeatus]|uniref:proline-rich protein 36-like n=1 Tax=Tachyglossus aculeatus TaxID=9261 RepID=UPI0018F78E96|nr:proline-rich protein 36-like [Tachyglossus aculeatus]